MGYDRFPERLIDEKKTLLTSIVEDDAWVFFTHDRDIAVSKIEYDPHKKRFKTGRYLESFSRSEF